MIWEDEDNLGYWTGPPPHGGYPTNPRVVNSTAACYGILPKQQAANIEWAAAFEHNNEPAEAELCRERAGYGRC